MKLHILQENLLKCLQRTGRIVSNKPQLPILQNILLETQGNLLHITATNMETTVMTTSGAKVEKEGGLCVQAKLLADLVSSLPQETVVLEEKEGALLVSTTRTKATLPGIGKGEFPPMNVPKKEKRMMKGDKDILEGLGKALFAAATDEGRPILTGVKMETKGQSLLLAATDGYRLSVVTISDKTGEEFDLVVPARALIEVLKIAGEKEEGEDGVAFTQAEDGQLTFVIGDTRVMTRILDGEYPDFRKIIPKTHTTRAVFDAGVFSSAVKSAAIFARDNANIVRLHIEKNGMTVSANTPQVGQSAIDVDATVEGDGGDIAFNSRFLTEMLANFPGEEIVFEMTGSLNPGVFHPDKDDTYFHIIMPVRVQG